MFHFTTLFIGMDVHKESFSLCCYDRMANQFKHEAKIKSHRLFLPPNMI
ncbi:Mobile element protein [Streptococcus sp. DD11]|nr:Mobile element protein [Streptococcus sp. DD11]